MSCRPHALVAQGFVLQQVWNPGNHSIPPLHETAHTELHEASAFSRMFTFESYSKPKQRGAFVGVVLEVEQEPVAVGPEPEQGVVAAIWPFGRPLRTWPTKLPTPQMPKHWSAPC